MIKYPSQSRAGRSVFPITVLALLCAINAPRVVHAAESNDSGPIAVVQHLQAGMLSLIAAQDGTSFAERFEICKVFVRETHDLQTMARLALGRRWNTLDDAEQAEFLELFTKLSISTYASRFHASSDIDFKISAQHEMARGRVEVRSSLIKPNGDAVRMSYILHRTNSEFRIINIMTEGVSELVLQRSQYQRILDDSDFAALTRYMQTKIMDMTEA